MSRSHFALLVVFCSAIILLGWQYNAIQKEKIQQLSEQNEQSRLADLEQQEFDRKQEEETTQAQVDASEALASSRALTIRNELRKECQATLDDNTEKMLAIASTCEAEGLGEDCVEVFLADVLAKGIISNGSDGWIENCIAAKEEKMQ